MSSETLKAARREALLNAWTDFLDANPDDLTSPSDLPDHALVTFEQMADIVENARLAMGEPVSFDMARTPTQERELERHPNHFSVPSDHQKRVVLSSCWNGWSIARLLAAKDHWHTRALKAEASLNTQAATDVLTERRRQIEDEGWTPEHDDKHSDGSMALAAACYAMFASVSDRQRAVTDLPASLTVAGKAIPGWAAWLEIWPWARSWWKPKHRRADLVRAGALILAEIERLDRKATP